MSPRGLVAIALGLALAGCGGPGGPPTVPDPPVAEPPSAPAPPLPPPGAFGCDRTSVGYTPLTDIGPDYQGEPGGLYPGHSNQPPPDHLNNGLLLARSVVPLDSSGAARPDGRYVLVSIGMSNTTQEFSEFKPLADSDASKDPHLVIVDGAQSGQTAGDWRNPGCKCWPKVDQRLQEAEVGPRQVSVAWIKLANREPLEGWPLAARRLQDDQIVILQMLKMRYPNLRLAYLSSRIYAGYATIPLNPEPYAYEGGYSVKWTIEDQINGSPALSIDPAAGPVRAPWVAWGPYLWADGLRPRSDGLTWACSDFESDGTHPSRTGERKVADRLLAFFRSDVTAREWFLERP